MKNNTKKRIQWLLCSCVLFFVVGVPILIDLSYSLPFTLFYVEWSASELLEYYSTVLGIGATVLSIIASVMLAVTQILHQQQYQHAMKMWNEIEQQINEAIGVINPAELSYIRINRLKPNEPATVSDVITQMLSYRKNLTMVIDRFAGSLNGVNQSGLDDLINSIVEMRDALICLAERDSNNCMKFMRGIRNIQNASEHSSIRRVAKQVFGIQDENDTLNKQKMECYQEYRDTYASVQKELDEQKEKYQELIKQKSRLFNKIYHMIAQQKPILSWNNFFSV